MSKEQSCNTCRHCDKSKIETCDNGILHRYSCPKREKGFTGWVRKDSTYDDYECGDYEGYRHPISKDDQLPGQTDIFDFI